MRNVTSLLLVIALVLTASFAFAQQGAMIKGKVLDENGEPMQGANVYVKGTEIGHVDDVGMSTDMDGNYEFTVPAKYANGQEVTLYCTFVSYKEATATITLRTGTITQNFELELDVLKLDEIVVSGVIGDTPKKKLAFTIEKVTKEELQLAPQNSMGTAVSGKVSSAKVKSSSGRPGSDTDMRFRGNNSIQRGNTPLIIVDGVILGDVNMADLDALDIEDIELIKGAAAASLFGSRAANGVMSITTQRGKGLALNQTKMTIRSEFGFSALAGYDNPISQHHEFLTDGTKWLDTSGNEVAADARVIDFWKSGISFQDNEYFQPMYDNLELFFEPGQYKRNSITIGQNIGKTNWRASFADQKDAGIIVDMKGYNRRNVRMNLDHSLRDGLTFSMSGYYMASNREVGDDAFYALMFMSPIANLLAPNPDGTPYKINADPVSLEDNPLYQIHNREQNQKRNRVMGSFNLRYAPYSFFNVASNFSYDRSDRNNTNYTPVGYKTFENPIEGGNGSYSKNNGITQAINSDITASVNYSFMDFNTRWKARYLYETETNTGFNANGSTFTVGDVRDLAAIEGNISVNSYFNEVISHGFFFITGWDYKDKYIADYLMRWDGSSLFGPDERWNNYFRASLAYRLSEEPWFDFGENVNNVKLRYSIGTAGNRPGFSAQYETYSVSSGTVSKSTLGNKALKPEYATEQEMGIDIGLFDKLSVELTYATTRTEDQILNVPLPGFYGFSSQYQNAGTMESKTYEGSISYQVMQSRDFNWNARLVADRTRSKIVDFDRPGYRTGGASAFYIRDDEEYGTMYGKHWMGHAGDLPEELQQYSSEFAVNDDGLLVWVGDASWTDGISGDLWGTEKEFTYTTTNDDGDQVEISRTYEWGFPIERLDTAGLNFQPLGRATPDYSLGLTNDFRWKGLTVHTVFDGQIGGMVYNQTKSWAYRELKHTDVDQFGKAEGNKKPIRYYSTLYAVNNVNGFFAEEVSFIKFRELSLRYTFNKSQIISGLGESFGGWLDRVNIGVIGRNLMTFSGYSGFDPEVVGGTTFRVDNFHYPMNRQFTGFLEIEF